MAAIFDKYDTNISALGYQLRAFVLAQLPGIAEEVDMAANILGYSYGPGYKNVICTIIPSKAMMKLGFYKGSELPDPTHLLTGKGKVHKYIEIKKPQDIDRQAVKDLLAAGYAAWQVRMK